MKSSVVLYFIMRVSINFAANIKFVSKQRYEKELQKTLLEEPGEIAYTGWLWDMNETTICKNGYSNSIKICIGGGITDPARKKMILFHLLPVNVTDDPQEVEKFSDFNHDLDNLPEVDSEVKDNPKSCLVIGGYSRNKHCWKALKNLLSIFKSIFSSQSSRPSIIFGKKTGFTDILYRADEDTWFVNAAKSNIKKPLDLKKAYAYIDISPDDQVYIGDREINSEEINQKPENPDFTSIQFI